MNTLASESKRHAIMLGCALVERIANRALAFDKLAHQALVARSGSSIKVVVTDHALPVLIQISHQGLLITPFDDDTADCTLSGTLDALIALKDASIITQSIRQGDIDLEGDLHLAQALSQTFNHLDVDLTDWLAPWLGDGLSHHVKTGHDWLFDRLKHKATELGFTFTTLMQDELAVTIHPLELEQFTAQNRALKHQLAALDARIQSLNAAITKR